MDNCLNGLSYECKKAIIDKKERGDGDLWASIMSVLGRRKHNGSLKDVDTEKKHYRKYSKRKVKINDIEPQVFDELFNYAYAYFMSKDENHKILNHPLTSYDNRRVAKGAMIMALEKCSVSEKNIKGMLGVIDYILQTTSEYELKQTYKEHIRAYKKENDNDKDKQIQ